MPTSTRTRGQAGADDPAPVWEGIRTSFHANDKRINLPGGGFIDGLEWERWAAGTTTAGGRAGDHAGRDGRSDGGCSFRSSLDSTRSIDRSSSGRSGDVGDGGSSGHMEEDGCSGHESERQGQTWRGSGGGDVMLESEEAPPGAALTECANEHAVGHLVNHPSHDQVSLN